MKELLAHLPQEKQDELKLIVEWILAFISPAKVILFSSYARGDYKEESDLEPDRKSGHASNYDILVITEQKQIARDHFEQWFEQAKVFYKHFEYGLKDKDYSHAAFELNQSAEACFKVTLLVCTSYIPNEHHLNLLGEHCAKYSIDLLNVFPMETQQQRDMFELLDYAYIGARYDKDYEITKEQLDQLAPCLKKLHAVTEKNCKEKIESFV